MRVAVSAALLGCAHSADGTKTKLPGMSSPELNGTFAVFETSRGRIEARLFTDEAPKTAANFKALAARSFYDGSQFHKVLPGFLVQGGAPAEGAASFGQSPIPDEFHVGRGFSRPGILAAASSAADKNGPEFFITLTPAPWLEKRHTAFGEVVSGLETAAAIAATPRDGSDRPLEPQILNRVIIEER